MSHVEKNPRQENLSNLREELLRPSHALPCVQEKVELPLIYIKWVDSCHMGGWIQLSDLARTYRKEELIQETAGFLLRETEYSYMVIQSKSVYWTTNSTTDFALDSMMEIPKAAVLEVYNLTKKKNAKKNPLRQTN